MGRYSIARWTIVLLSLFTLVGTPLVAGVKAENSYSDSPALGVGEVPPVAPRTSSDGTRDLPVFGENLFSGSFSRESFTGFNPDYVIHAGDKLELKMWGAYDFEDELTVDAQGNIFVPRVGPIKVLGVRNGDLPTLVQRKIRSVYKSNVGSYVNLVAAQPVKVFVTGFVKYPGMYGGLSSDSLLYFLDQAGGIDPGRGSFIDIEVKRPGRAPKSINLYDFILDGERIDLQFQDGDTIVVPPRHYVVKVKGLVRNAYQFEFDRLEVSLNQVLSLAKPKAEATHVRVIRGAGPYRNIDYYPLEEINDAKVRGGDIVVITADKKPGMISVRVEGEHNSAQEYVLPYGTTLGELLERIDYSPASDVPSISLFRRSVKIRQKQMLEQSLRTLEMSVLTARSATSGEVGIRKGEADLVLEWIKRARSVEPKGQVVLGDPARASAIILENGDVVRIPIKSNLVMVSGEVLFPTATVYDPSLKLLDYIERAGGFAQNEKAARVVVLHPGGAFTKVKRPGWGMRMTADIQPGDEILVLPKIDLKRLQISKDFTQVLYQVAVAAGVVLSL